jgi:hypothetical protein
MKQLELFAPPPEIPENLKALLLGNGENDFTMGIQVAKGLGVNLVECLELALLNFDIDIPDSSEYEHFELKYGDISFRLVEFEYEDVSFWLIIKTPESENEIALCEWEETDDYLTMKTKIKRKIKAIVKDNYHYLKQLSK